MAKLYGNNSLFDLFPGGASSGRLVPLGRGASGASRFILEEGDERFFVKVSPGAEPRKVVLDRLLAAGYACPRCVSEHVAQGRTCRVYDYIDGKNGREAEEFVVGDAAVRIVDNLRILESLDMKLASTLPPVSVGRKLEECLDDIDVFFRERNSPFPYPARFFRGKAEEYAASFRDVVPLPIHGDVKIDNFMSSDAGLYVLDDGDLSVGPFAFNFQYGAHQLYLQDDRGGQLMKEVISEYYNGRIPLSFHNNLKFILIRKFFDRYKDKEPGKSERFVSIFAHIFHEIFTCDRIACLEDGPGEPS